MALVDSSTVLYPSHAVPKCKAIIITIIIIIEAMVSCWSHSYLCITLKCQSCQVFSTQLPRCFSDFLLDFLLFLFLYWLFSHTQDYVYNPD